ncbi:uncharacterized protein LOC136082089 [Hydra vulgaris]|uniref:Uncharacterized protein LOC136082089 n=1 Tax=Hydra vulgaris TaxID=6087 RepID=A0ABM4C599_HYDVU
MASKIQCPDISFETYITNQHFCLNIFSELNHEELEIAKNSLKTNKAPGIDDICSYIGVNVFPEIKQPIYEIFKSLIVTGSVPNKLKITKIVCHGTYNYKLAKYLSDLLSPYIPKFFPTCESFSFVEELKQVDITNKYIVSYDVESLFTNIPLDETIDKATDLYFEDDTYCVAIGSLLVPILANIFIGFHEQKWVSNCSSSIPIFHKRYVDDIIAILNSEFEAQEFFTHLNKQPKNLKFTTEKEQDNQIAFLDVFINKSVSLSTSVYHKKTSTGLLQKFSSFVLCHEIRLIRCVIDRTYKINNTWLG